MIEDLGGKYAIYLDLLSHRQRLVAANIANADTPDYRTQDIDFPFEFQAALAAGSLPWAPQIVGVPSLAVRNDGNDVSLDREARLLAENAQRFALVSQLLARKFAAVKSAIKEGRG
jgi:flagellar basal-body rod protein FlgB